MRRLLGPTVAVAFVLAATVGCSSDMDQMSDDDPQVPLTALDEAPERVPQVAINGLSIPPVQYEWFTDGAWDRQTVEDPSLISIPQVPAAVTGLSITVSAPVFPEIVMLYEYDQLDADGHPQGQPSRVDDCLANADCDVQVVEDHLEIVSPNRLPAAVTTLVLAYGRTTGLDERPVVLITASWVFTLS